MSAGSSENTSSNNATNPNKIESLYKLIRFATEKGGEKLGDITQQKKNINNKTAVNESQAQKTSDAPSDNAFQQQIPKLTKKLFGNRVPKVFKYIGKFIPQSVTNNLADTVFLKVALLAEKWSKIDLPEGYAGNSENLSADDKNIMMKAIADQNRLFAAAGSGVTGATGIFGTIVDLLWLLLLALRMIYQTAEVAGKPLTGTIGTQTAFEVLSKADLSVLTEKQAVIISMGAAGEIVDDIDFQVLEGLLKSDGDIAFFREAISSIAEQLNISFNMDWMLKFLPVATGVTSAVYSVYIMNEISAVVLKEYAISE